MPGKLTTPPELFVNPTIQGYRLSTQQKRLWLLHKAVLLRLRSLVLVEGSLEKRQLTAALSELVRRHEILRTRFECLKVMDVPVQVVMDEAEVRPPEIDLTMFDDQEQQRQLQSLKQQQAVEPYQARLLRLGEQRHILETEPVGFVRRHLVHRQALPELAQGYARTNEGAEAGVQYVDFSGAQRRDDCRVARHCESGWRLPAAGSDESAGASGLHVGGCGGARAVDTAGVD